LAALLTPQEVFAHPETPFVASFTGSVNLFQARVAGTDSSLVLDWNDRQLEVSRSDHEVGEEVWFCIRPEYVTIADDSAADEANIPDGTITRRVFEGDDYLADITPEGMDDPVQIELSPPVYDQSRLAAEVSATVSSERTKEGIAAAKSAGKHVGRPLFGFDADGEGGGGG
jgi:ABC-type Fe3+/spermidine/putrescine transport system ATPase subunit